ncbi:sigma factor-like helix-turn-helix DNA-binding protein [Microlunatus parietis]
MWRQESPHVLAALLRRYGDLGDCEDAAQEAAEAAAAQWPAEGVPDNPRAWLIRVASRRLIDRFRSDQARAGRETSVGTARPSDADLAPAADAPRGSDADDTLRLILLCCHPSLSRPSQVALTLQSMAGLSTEQIAAAYLVPARTMAQRLTRARATLREAGARFELPGPDEWPDRIAAVLDVCHLMFNEGYTRSGGDALQDITLTSEAIRLTRQLRAALPDHDEVAGALALMLLTQARAGARTDAAGDLVPLAEQDRRLWDRALIAEGVAILESVLPRGPVGRYQLSAAIAAVQAEAPTAADVDWLEISLLYGMLDRVAPSPAVTLNRAVAVGEALGPEQGLMIIDELLRDKAMQRHHRAHAVRAHLLERAGDLPASAEAYRRAAQLTTSLPEQRYLNRRFLQASEGPSTP